MSNTNIPAIELNVSLLDEICLTSAHLDNLSRLYEGYIMNHRVQKLDEDEMIDVTHTVREIRQILTQKRREMESRMIPEVKPQPQLK